MGWSTRPVLHLLDVRLLLLAVSNSEFYFPKERLLETFPNKFFRIKFWKQNLKN